MERERRIEDAFHHKKIMKLMMMMMKKGPMSAIPKNSYFFKILNEISVFRRSRIFIA